MIVQNSLSFDRRNYLEENNVQRCSPFCLDTCSTWKFYVRLRVLGTSQTWRLHPVQNTFPPFKLLCYSEKCTFYSVRFFSWVKKTLWTQELLKRHLLLWTLLNQSMLKLVRELINHLSLQVQVLNDEPIGSAELTSKTRNLCANYTNTQVVMCTSTTSVTVHKWSIHSSRDNLHSRLSFSDADFERLTSD